MQPQRATLCCVCVLDVSCQQCMNVVFAHRLILQPLARQLTTENCGCRRTASRLTPSLAEVYWVSTGCLLGVRAMDRVKTHAYRHTSAAEALEHSVSQPLSEPLMTQITASNLDCHLLRFGRRFNRRQHRHPHHGVVPYEPHRFVFQRIHMLRVSSGLQPHQNAPKDSV